MRIDKNVIYLLPFLLLLLTQELFQPFDYQTVDAANNPYILVLNNVSKIVPLLCFAYLIFRFQKFSSFILFIYVLAFAFFVFMTFESLYYYNSPLEFPHVILKLLDIFVVLAFISFYFDHNEVRMSTIMNVIILGLFMKIAINPSMVSINAFITHDRGLPAPSVYLLSLPCLYFFNVYAVELKFSAFLKFLLLFLFILFFNHRTVWVTISFSLVLNLIMLRNNKEFKVRKMFQSFVLLGLIGLLGVSFVISYFPDVVDKINENIVNITNPEEDSTAGWRILQFESYWPFAKEHIFGGLRWKGFELPIQFYHPEADVPYFEEGHGHHFHSFYFDRLFYFGLIGLIVFLVILNYPIYLILKYRLELNSIQLSFFIFSVSGLVFGISYNLPDYFWFTLGITIAYLEFEKRKKENQGGVLSST